MTIQRIMEDKNITRYRLSKRSGVPYTTITDILSGKAQLEKCTAETIYKVSKVLGVSMEELLEPCFEERSSFELFKSNVCHRLKEKGDIQFIIDTLEDNEIRRLYNKKWYPESLYLLAMLDYISRVNDVSVCTDYNDIRTCKLKEPLYPMGVLTLSAVSGDFGAKEETYRDAIPEFIRFNIVESEVRNVI